MMVFLIQGNAEEIFSAFGQRNFIVAVNDKDTAIITDIPRSQFFGTIDQCESFREVWLDKQQSPVNQFAQGNMTAGNLFLPFCQKGKAFPLSFYKNKNETDADLSPQIKKLCFGYIDENGDVRGLSLCYRKDDPEKWIIGLSKNANLPPKDADVKILTSFDPRSSCQLPCNISAVSAQDNELTKSIASHTLETFIKQILMPSGKINPSAVIELFLQFAGEGFLDNAGLLESFAAKMPELLASKVLGLLSNFGQRPSLEQLSQCLDPESQLYKWLDAFQVEVDETNTAQLALLLALDRYGLNHRQEAIREDNIFVRKLYALLQKQHDNILSTCLADEPKTKVLRFITQSKRYVALFNKLKEIEDSSIWGKFADLADYVWQFPQDAFCHAVICRLLLNSPAISGGDLEELYKTLRKKEVAEVIERVFEPFALADYLTRSENEDNYNQQLIEAANFFRAVLPNYERTAEWKKKPLSNEFLSILANEFMQGRDREFLASLYDCNSEEQLKAAFTLEQLGCKDLPIYLANPAVVSAVNLLTSCDLKNVIEGVLKDRISLVAIGEIHNQLGNDAWRKACLILYSQDQLDPTDFGRLMESFKIYPKLALQIIYKQNEFSPEDIKTLAFTPSIHQAESFLRQYSVKCSFEQLQPFTCQLTLAIADVVRNKILADGTIRYLEAILPIVLQVTNHEINWEGAQEQLKEKNTELTEARPASVLDKELSTLILEQLEVFATATQNGVPCEQQLTKTKYIAKELARALEQLTSKLDEMQKGSLEERDTKNLYQDVFASFSALDASDHVSAESTCYAIDAFVGHRLQNPEANIPFDALLKNSSIAKAALAIKQHDLPAETLFGLDKPLQTSIVNALVKLGQIAPDCQSAFQLAMQDDRKGHDFRLLLTRTTNGKLINLLQKGVEEDRISAEYEDIGKNIDDARLRKQASNLDECLILINRLRALNFDDQFIEFAVKNNEKSRQFYKAILRIEEECQGIRARLKKASKTDGTAKDKSVELTVPEQNYRKDLYQAIYEAFNAPKDKTPEQTLQKLTKKIQKAEEHIKDIVEKDRHPELRIAMAVIVNIITLVFTATIANLVHQKTTGDFLFFYRPASSEALNSLNKQVYDDISTAIKATSSA